MKQLSLYLHIPFCIHTCSYCSFFVVSEEESKKQKKEHSIEDLKQRYLESLTSEMSNSPIRNAKIYTLYLWGGTPYQLWQQRLLELLHTINDSFDLSELRECTIEINPDPLDRVPAFMKLVQENCPFLKGLRRSIGTQTFDDSLLSASKRAYNFAQLQDFFYELSLQKSPSIRYNLDLIAFGKLLENGIPWGTEQMKRFTSLLEQKLFDSISLYTLELFPGSDWYHQSHHTSKAVQKVYGNDDMIFEEFVLLRNLIYRYGYKRQELSNFALDGKGSLHNDVYRSMESYLWLGINSSSYLSHEDAKRYFWSSYEGIYGVRFQNTKKRKQYLNTVTSNQKQVISNHNQQPIYESYEELSREQYLKDAFFLGLRKQPWLSNISQFQEILREDWKQEIEFLESIGKCRFEPSTETLFLTDSGFDVYNSVVNSLMK